MVGKKFLIFEKDILGKKLVNLKLSLVLCASLPDNGGIVGNSCSVSPSADKTIQAFVKESCLIFSPNSCSSSSVGIEKTSSISFKPSVKLFVAN